jgi:hypothetical protein
MAVTNRTCGAVQSPLEGSLSATGLTMHEIRTNRYNSRVTENKSMHSIIWSSASQILYIWGCLEVNIWNIRTCNSYVKCVLRIKKYNCKLYLWITFYYIDTYSGLARLVTMGSGFDYWVYWHFFTITIYYYSPQLIISRTLLPWPPGPLFRLLLVRLTANDLRCPL